MIVPSQRSAELVVALARALVVAMREQAPNWQRAYIRFEATEDSSELKGSYVTLSDACLINVLEYRNLFEQLRLFGEELREELSSEGKKFCLFLLVVDADLQYSIDYEWNDRTRWKITKLDGGTGIPEGVKAPALRAMSSTNADGPSKQPGMLVVEHAPARWFLLQEGQRYYFDARISRSAVEWSLLIELTEQECRNYSVGGKTFLDRLAARINDCTDEYSGRDLDAGHRSDVFQAVQEWRTISEGT